MLTGLAMIAASGCALEEPPECMTDTFKCDPIDAENEGNACNLHRCVDSRWQLIKTCYNGWNLIYSALIGEAECNPPCESGAYKCEPDNDSQNEIACSLYKCEDNEWKYKDSCENGWNKITSDLYGGGKCNPKCKSDTYKCERPATAKDGDRNSACTIHKCKEDTWESIDDCKFGWNHSNDATWISDDQTIYEYGECIDPCAICPTSAGKIPCDKIQDNENKIIYSCDKTGWHRDYSCTNDLIRNDSLIGEINPNLFSKYNTDIEGMSTDLIAGTCGKCNSDSQPTYYTYSNDTYVYHGCNNGDWDVHTEKKAQIDNKYLPNGCMDTYGETIYVDIQTNRYHCGECNKACGVSQKCASASCESNWECDADGYAPIQVGGQTIRAYCIETSDDLEDIAQSINKGNIWKDNYDNAYVLTKDIQVRKSWTPIGTAENAFKGIFFGNNKTITIPDTIEQRDHMGLFGHVKDSHIEHLTIAFGAEQNYTINELLSTIHFGGLAGYTEGSTFDSIQLNLPKTTINLENLKNYVKVSGECPITITDTDNIETAFIGSLVGRSQNDTFTNIDITSDFHVVNGQKVQVGGVIGYAEKLTMDNVSLNVTVEGQNDWYPLATDKALDRSAVGGLIGQAIDVKSITRIRQEEGAKIDVTGYVLVGGLIGRIEQKTVSGVISNTGISALSTNVNAAVRYIGGLIGYIKPTEAQSAQNATILVEDFSLKNSNITISYNNDIKSLNAFTTFVQITSCEADNSNKFLRRFAGGVIGATGSTKNKRTIEIRNISMDNATIVDKIEDNSDNIYNSIVGGFAGKLQSAILSDITIQNITYKSEESATTLASSLGVYTGSDDGCIHNNISISDVKINILTERNKINNFGILAGYSSNSEFSNCTLNKASIAIDANESSYISGMIGHSMNNTINESTIQNVSITAPNSKFVGFAAGYAINTTLNDSIFVCDNTTTRCAISGKEYVGGFFGRVEGLHVGCTNDSRCNKIVNLDINGTGNAVGGFIGAMANVEDKHNTITHVEMSDVEINNTRVEGHNQGSTGGLAGVARHSLIDDIKFTDVTVNNENAAPENDGNTTQLYGTGALLGYAEHDNSIRNIVIRNNKVTGTSTTGSIAGYIKLNSSFIANNLYISDSEIYGSNQLGGMFGLLQDNTTVSIDNATVFVTLAPPKNTFVGGIVGSIAKVNHLSIMNSAWIADDASNNTKTGEFAGEVNTDAPVSILNAYALIHATKGDIPFIYAPYDGLQLVTHKYYHIQPSQDASTDVVVTECKPNPSDHFICTDSDPQPLSAKLMNDRLCSCKKGSQLEKEDDSGADSIVCMRQNSTDICSTINPNDTRDYCSPNEATNNTYKCDDDKFWHDYKCSNNKGTENPCPGIIKKWLAPQNNASPFTLPLPFDAAPQNWGQPVTPAP